MHVGIMLDAFSHVDPMELFTGIPGLHHGGSFILPFITFSSDQGLIKEGGWGGWPPTKNGQHSI